MARVEAGVYIKMPERCGPQLLLGIVGLRRGERPILLLGGSFTLSDTHLLAEAHGQSPEINSAESVMRSQDLLKHSSIS
jgi:hypothetical protein